MPFSGPYEDRVAIRELIETYCDAVNRRDATAWSKTWSDDAVWDLQGHHVSGKASIVATWQTAMAEFSYVGFFAVPGAIEVTGTTGTARVYVRETLVTEQGDERRIEGLYEDDLEKSTGAWVFKKRKYKIIWQEGAN